MTALLLDGKALSQKIEVDLAARVAVIKEKRVFKLSGRNLPQAVVVLLI